MTFQMKKFAVIGHPVDHSLSPAMFNAAFKSLGLDYIYGREDVEIDGLKSLIDSVKNDLYQGFSVTVPYKEEVIKYLDELTPEATTIKAVNTVYKLNGKVIGGNTDWTGFKKALTEKIDLENKTILIYGAGGVARACLYALRDYKENVFLTNRTKEKGESLANEFNVKFIDKDLLPKVDIFINATSVGLKEKNEMVVSEEWLKNTKLVFDLLYGETLLFQSAKKMGIETVDGKKMLLYQAIEQFKIFTGINAPIQVMKEALGL